MSEPTAEAPLRYALVLVGVVFILGIYPLMIVWPSGWQWAPGHPQYEQMIVGIYATLGLFLLLASRDPLEHLSLIWFTVWSSVVHGGIMLWQALADPAETGHLFGDVPALFLVALVLGWLTKRATSAERTVAAKAGSAKGGDAPPERRGSVGA